MLITEQENIIQGFLFVFMICFIVPPLNPLSRNIKTFPLTRLCSSLWLPWILMSLLILMTLQHWGNIFPRPSAPELGVKVSSSISEWRLPTMAERSHQTTKQANIIVIIKQPQPGPVRPGQPGEGRFLFFFVFAILKFTGDKIIRLWIGNFVIFSVIHHCWL